MQPYYRTDQLKPGLRWGDMSTAGNYREHYVQLADGPVPVGVMIARELMDAGAAAAVCTDLTLGRIVLIAPDLVCVPLQGALGRVLEELFVANGNRWSGLPDAVGIFPDGRVAFREAKVANKDRLNKNQHDFARAARVLLGDRLDLAVVEWGREVASSGATTNMVVVNPVLPRRLKKRQLADGDRAREFLSLTPASTIRFFQEMFTTAERRNFQVKATYAGLKIHVLGRPAFLYCYPPAMYKRESSVLEVYLAHAHIKGTPLAAELQRRVSAISAVVQAGDFSWRVFVDNASVPSAWELFEIASEGMERQKAQE